MPGDMITCKIFSDLPLITLPAGPLEDAPAARRGELRGRPHTRKHAALEKLDGERGGAQADAAFQGGVLHPQAALSAVAPDRAYVHGISAAYGEVGCADDGHGEAGEA